MLILVNKKSGEIRTYRPAAAPQGGTLGTQNAEDGELAEDEILIDSSHQIYKPETGEVVEVPPWTPAHADVPLESRLAQMQTAHAALEARVANLEVEIIASAGTGISEPPKLAEKSGGE